MSYARNLARLARTGAPTFETAQDVRDMTLYGGIIPEVVVTLGALNKADKGGGVWFRDYSSSDIDDLGLTLVLSGSAPPARFKRNFTGPIDIRWFGADETGATAADSAIIAAASKGDIIISDGTFLVAGDIDIRARVSFTNGGMLSVPAGKTFVCDALESTTDQQIFVGGGTVKPRDDKYCVAWFPGDSFDAKWEACSRGFARDRLKYVRTGLPIQGEPSATTGRSSSTIAWKLLAPITFNDAQNLMDLTFEADIAAETGFVGDAMLAFSTIQKVEEITLHGSLRLWGNHNVKYGIDLGGGARLAFPVNVDIFDVLDVSLIYSARFPLSSIQFVNLYVIGFSVAGFYAKSTSGIQIGHIHINHLAFNGGGKISEGRPDPEYGVIIEGRSRLIIIDSITVNMAPTLYGPFTKAIVKVTPNSIGACRNLRINSALADSLTEVPFLICKKSASGPERARITLGQILHELLPITARVSPYLIQLEDAYNTLITGPLYSVDEVYIGGNCENIIVENIEPDQVTRADNVISTLTTKQGQLHTNLTIPVDTVGKVFLGSGVNGRVFIMVKSQPLAWAHIMVRGGNSFAENGLGSQAALSTSIPTGTSGATPSMTVNVTGGWLYIESRYAVTQTFVVQADLSIAA